MVGGYGEGEVEEIEGLLLLGLGMDVFLRLDTFS